MEGSEDLRSKISLYISKRVSITYINTSRLQISRSLTNVEEYITSLQSDIGTVRTGGYVEGLLLKGSDVDRMMVLPSIAATVESKRYHHRRRNLCELIMDTKGVRPGFSKLKLYNSNTLSKQTVHDIIKHCLINTNTGRPVYISSERFREYFVKGLKPFIDNSDMSVVHNGPCSTIVDKAISGTICADCAWAIECRAWPEEAMEWVSRPRPKGWPTEDEVSRLKGLPCHLLPIGDPKSENRGLEWRFAFVQVERELIWSFNDTQIHCLLLMKLVKHLFLESLAPDQLSSFYFKTIVFWESEKHGLDMWCEENLLNCVWHCLEKLKNSIKSRCLEHYIYKKRNLLYSKFSDQQQQTVVLQKIGEIQENLIHFLLKILGVQEEYDSIMKSNNAWIISPVLSNQFIDMQKAKDWEFRQFPLQNILFELFGSIVYRTLIQLTKDVKRNKISLEVSDKNTILSILSIAKGKFILAKLCETTNTTINEPFNHQACKNFEEGQSLDSVHQACKNFEEGQSLDSVSGSMYMATFLYTCKKHGKALKIISEVSSNSNKEKTMYVGGCASRGSLLLSSGKPYEDLLRSDNKLAAYDVIFTPKDASFVPHAVKFEFAFDRPYKRYLCLHPLVYAYYLYFQICLDLKKDKGCEMATCKLLEFLDLVPQEYKDPHSTHNLIGYCFYKSGWYDAALHCFRQSLLVCNDKKNVAALYLWFMFLDMERKTEEGIEKPN